MGRQMLVALVFLVLGLGACAAPDPEPEVRCVVHSQTATNPGLVECSTEGG